MVPVAIKKYLEPLGSLQGWLPFLDTLPGYDGRRLRADLVSGLTVALVALPQSMAYALVAGLPAVYGLYGAIVAGFFASLFGSSAHMVTGPSVMSIVVGSILSHSGWGDSPGPFIAALCIGVGLWQLLFGILKLGNIGQFISQSVLFGLVSGAAIVITGTQIGPLLGLDVAGISRLPASLAATVRQIGDVRFLEIGLGVSVMAVLLLGDRISRRVPWAIIALAGVTAAVALFGWEDRIHVVGSIPRSFPALTFGREAAELVPEVMASALAVALFGAVSSLSISKSIAALSGEQISSNQELVAQGLANGMAGFFGGMPSTGSFVRSFTNYASGGRTRFAGVFASVFLMSMVLLLGDVGRWIPRAGLAGLVIVLALRMLRFDRVVLSFRTTKSDAAVWSLTFLCALLFRLDTAIYCGIGLSLVLFLKRASAPYLREYSIEEQTNGFREIHGPSERSVRQIALIHVEGDLFFGAADVFENEIRRLARDPDIRVIILRMRGARYLDTSGLVALSNLHTYLKSRGQHLLLCGIGDRVMQILERSGLADRLGRDSIFHARDGVLVSTRRALQKAMEIVGTAGEKPGVRLFYERDEIQRRRGSGSP